MQIYVINGRTKGTGVWDVEAYKGYESARAAFESYVYEYEAKEKGEDFAECDEGTFWIEEVEVVE